MAKRIPAAATAEQIPASAAAREAEGENSESGDRDDDGFGRREFEKIESNSWLQRKRIASTAGMMRSSSSFG